MPHAHDVVISGSDRDHASQKTKNHHSPDLRSPGSKPATKTIINITTAAAVVVRCRAPNPYKFSSQLRLHLLTPCMTQGIQKPYKFHHSTARALRMPGTPPGTPLFSNFIAAAAVCLVRWCSDRPRSTAVSTTTVPPSLCCRCAVARLSTGHPNPKKISLANWKW